MRKYEENTRRKQLARFLMLMVELTKHQDNNYDEVVEQMAKERALFSGYTAEAIRAGEKDLYGAYYKHPHLVNVSQYIKEIDGDIIVNQKIKTVENLMEVYNDLEVIMNKTVQKLTKDDVAFVLDKAFPGIDPLKRKEDSESRKSVSTGVISDSRRIPEYVQNSYPTNNTKFALGDIVKLKYGENYNPLVITEIIHSNVLGVTYTVSDISTSRSTWDILDIKSNSYKVIEDLLEMYIEDEKSGSYLELEINNGDLISLIHTTKYEGAKIVDFRASSGAGYFGYVPSYGSSPRQIETLNTSMVLINHKDFRQSINVSNAMIFRLHDQPDLIDNEGSWKVLTEEPKSLREFIGEIYSYDNVVKAYEGNKYKTFTDNISKDSGVYFQTIEEHDMTFRDDIDSYKETRKAIMKIIKKASK